MIRSSAVCLVAIAGIAACGAFGDASSSGGDAGTGTSTSSSGGNGDGGASGPDASPPTFCNGLPGARLCSSFDDSMNAQQTVTPDGKPWLTREDASGHGKLAIGTTPGLSAPNALTSGGNGASLPFQAQVYLGGLAFTQNVLRLTMALRVVKLPTGGDVYFATIDFGNMRFSLVMHADGTVDLAQSVPADATPSKTQLSTAPVGSSAWARVELKLDRATDKAYVDLNGTGGSAPLAVEPMGNAAVAIGIGYCDAPCGSPSLSFDDVVLTDE